jgi:hypothetical protein
VLLQQLREGELPNPEMWQGLTYDIVRLVPGMNPGGQAEVVSLLEGKLEDSDDGHSLYAFAVAMRLAEAIPDEEREQLATVIAARLERNPTSFFGEVGTSVPDVGPKFKEAIETARSDIRLGADLPAEWLQATEPRGEES